MHLSFSSLASLHVHFFGSRSVLEYTAGLIWVARSTRAVEIFLAGILEFVEDKESIYEDDYIELGLG